MLLKVLDIFFVCFHTTLIFFNLFGWLFRKTRRLNFITLLLTGLSWFFLGMFYGIGYCPLTHWHWQVLEKLGAYNPYNSYIQYLIDRLFDMQITSCTADTFTVIFYFAALAMSVYANFFRKHFRGFKSW